MARRLRRTRLVALAAVAGLGLAACGGSDIEEDDSAASGASDCGDLRIAVNPWTGYVSNAHVIGVVAQEELGCNVTYPEVKEEVGWQGMSDGSIDTIVENWGHPDLVAKYIDDQGTVEDAGLTGNDGIIGWYVPPWLAEEHPEVLDWENLNDFADEFSTSESEGKGQLLDGDPSYVTNDEALVKNLDLNYQVVVGGSEAALIQSFKSAEENKTPLLAYFYEPQWFFSEMQLVRVNLPPYEEGCDADAAAVDCDYPEYALNKIVATTFAENGGAAYEVVKNFTWTNEDQNLVSTYIARDGMSPDDAAKKWIEENQDKVDAWLS
jgi:glycine betaine/proline transport system substrate-binding protein